MKLKLPHRKSKQPPPSQNKPETVYAKTKPRLFLFTNQAYFFSNVKTFFLVVLIKTKMYAGLTMNSDGPKTFVLMKLSIWRGLNFRECFQGLCIICWHHGFLISCQVSGLFNTTYKTSENRKFHSLSYIFLKYLNNKHVLCGDEAVRLKLWFLK